MFKNISTYLLLVLCIIWTSLTYAQTTDAKHITNLKLIAEYADGKGNWVTIVQYNQGNVRVKETVIRPMTTKAKIGIKPPINFDTIQPNKLQIIVSKSEYTLELRYNNKPIRAYKAVFGPDPSKDKCMEGDRCTPEGTFKISTKNAGSKYTKFLGINYPNEATHAKFAKLKSEGKVPAQATIGSNLGIHGIWKGGDDMIELGIGWTDGCVAIKNADIEELFKLVDIGTPVIIKK